MRLINDNKKEKAKTLNIKMFCLSKKFFDLKEFINCKEFCLKEEFNFKKVVNKLV